MATTRRRQKGTDNNQLKKATATATAMATAAAKAMVMGMVTAGGSGGDNDGNNDNTTTAATASDDDGGNDDDNSSDCGDGGGDCCERRRLRVRQQRWREEEESFSFLSPASSAISDNNCRSHVGIRLQNLAQSGNLEIVARIWHGCPDTCARFFWKSKNLAQKINLARGSPQSGNDLATIWQRSGNNKNGKNASGTI